MACHKCYVLCRNHSDYYDELNAVVVVCCYCHLSNLRIASLTWLCEPFQRSPQSKAFHSLPLPMRARQLLIVSRWIGKYLNTALGVLDSCEIYLYFVIYQSEWNAEFFGFFIALDFYYLVHSLNNRGRVHSYTLGALSTWKWMNYFAINRQLASPMESAQRSNSLNWLKQRFIVNY